MADEDCCASSHEIKLVLLLYFLMLSLSGEKCSVHTFGVQYPVSCHLSPCTHQKFHNHLYCHKCHKVVCCGNVKDHIEHNLCATNNSLKTLAYLLKTSSTLAPMELQISNEHMAVPNNIFTDTSKNTYGILAMCTPYKKVCKFFKTTKIYFKKNYTYTLYKFTKLIIVKKLFNTLKALSYKNVFQRLPIFQLQCTRNKVPEKLEGRQQDIKRLNVAVVAVTKDSCKALGKHLAGYDIPSLNVSLLTKKDIDNKAKKSQKEEKLPKINVSTQLSVIKKGNKFQNANDVYQATLPSSVSLEHKLIFGNVTTTKPSCTTDHKPLGAHIVMGLQSKKLVSTICPQNDILFNTKLIEHNVQTLHEEVKQTRNEMVRFHQFDIKRVYPQMDIKKLNFPNIPQVHDKLPVKLYTVTIQENKTATIALPKRSYILCRHERYPIINCYPYMDHCYEQKRTQIQSSHCFLKTSTTFIFSFGLLSEGDCLEDIVLTFYTKSCSCSSDKNHYKIDNIALTFHPIMSYDLQNLCLVSFFAYILNSNHCARKADINRLVEPPLLSNFAASLIKLTEGFMRSSLYAILRKLYQLMAKLLTKNLEIIKYLEAMFNIRFKEPSKSSISEEKGHGNNLLEQILLSDMIGLPIFVSDEDKKRNNKHMPLQVVGNSQLLNSALKFQANVNAVFSLAINKVNTENNTEIQGSISSIQSKYLLSEMLPEYYKSIFKDNKLLATLPSLAPKCSTALNTREVIFSTTL